MNYKHLIAYLGQSKSRQSAKWELTPLSRVIDKCTNLSYIIQADDYGYTGLKIKIDPSCEPGKLTELDESDWQYWYSSTYHALFAEPRPGSETGKSLRYDNKITQEILDYLDNYYRYHNSKPKNTYISLLSTL